LAERMCCCGMAASFGFEQDKYEVSITCCERVLVPAVRAADAESDGFSCGPRQLRGVPRACRPAWITGALMSRAGAKHRASSTAVTPPSLPALPCGYRRVRLNIATFGGVGNWR
jgi:hypothetical protein